MVRRSVEEWRALFSAQARSGLTANQFCEEQGLCPKYFSLRKKALCHGAPVSEPSPFVRIAPMVETPAQVASGLVRLRLGRGEWELSGVAFEDLARLMQALA